MFIKKILNCLAMILSEVLGIKLEVRKSNVSKNKASLDDLSRQAVVHANEF